MSDKVTKRQKAVLDCIEECIREKGYGPTVREVCPVSYTHLDVYKRQIEGRAVV